MPQVSIVIPVYNVSRIVETTLRDFLSQEFRNFELIVVDDGSTDGTPDLVSSILSKNCIPYTLLKHEHNQGVSSARNTGLQAAKGKYILFFDGDDRIQKNALGKLYSLAENNNASLVFSGFKVSQQYSGKDRSYSLKGGIEGFQCEKKHLLLSFFRGKRWLNASNTLYDRTFLYENDIRFTRGCRFAEDREFIAKAIFNAKSIFCDPECLVAYVQHENQSTSRMTSDPSKYAHGLGVYLRLRKYLADKGAAKKILNSIDSFEIPNAVIKMASEAAKSGNKNLFAKITSNTRLRKMVIPGWKTVVRKPEIAFKAIQFMLFPEKLYSHYHHRNQSDSVCGLSSF